VRASLTMLVAAGPLAAWGAWVLWVSASAGNWTGSLVGGGALIVAAGLLRLLVWAKYLAYAFAVFLSISWMYIAWIFSSFGRSRRSWGAALQSLTPGVLMLGLCVAGVWVIHREYLRPRRALRAPRAP